MADILLISKHTMSILQRAGERTLTWPQYSFCRVYSGKVPKISEVYHVPNLPGSTLGPPLRIIFF